MVETRIERKTGIMRRRCLDPCGKNLRNDPMTGGFWVLDSDYWELGRAMLHIDPAVYWKQVVL